MVKRTRPNKRQRRTIRKHIDSINVHKLIAQYEREIKSTPLASEIDKLNKEILRLKQLIENGSRKEKHKARSVLQSKPNIASSITTKKEKSTNWVKVYQGGATGLKR